MEYLRELRVTVEIDTNKRGDTESFVLMDYETIEDFIERVSEKINESQNL